MKSILLILMLISTMISCVEERPERYDCARELVDRYSLYRNSISENSGYDEISVFLDISYLKDFTEDGKTQDYLKLYHREKSITKVEAFAGFCVGDRGYLKLKIRDDDSRFTRESINFTKLDGVWIMSIPSKELAEYARDFDGEDIYTILKPEVRTRSIE